MNIVKTIEEVQYNSPYFWNPSINKEARISDCLPNCTCFVVGSLKASGIADCVSVITDASSFHKHLTNGWYSVPYSEYKNDIKIGDVIEWEQGNHVAIVSDIKDGVPWISGSFYTGIHGKAYYDGGYDTRDGFTSLKQVSDFMLQNYQYRYFHFVPLEEESKWCGGDPDYVLVCPVSINPTERDESKDQVYVGITGLRVRTEPNTTSSVRGTASVGYYNVDEIVDGGEHDFGNKWYRIGDLYFADYQGLIYYPRQELVPMEEMIKLMKQIQIEYQKVCDKNAELEAKLKAIRGLTDE